tara:strand:- start:666 stop:932 length:267 start_codon:yes stop_codon:yes gene_type:complete
VSSTAEHQHPKDGAGKGKMLIHKINSSKRTIFIIDGAETQTNFTRYEQNEKLGCIELYNQDVYIGIVKKVHAKNFFKAVEAANARKAA